MMSQDAEAGRLEHEVAPIVPSGAGHEALELVEEVLDQDGTWGFGRRG
jgi:hypothetical protein